MPEDEVLLRPDTCWTAGDPKQDGRGTFSGWGPYLPAREFFFVNRTTISPPRGARMFRRLYNMSSRSRQNRHCPGQINLRRWYFRYFEHRELYLLYPDEQREHRGVAVQTISVWEQTRLRLSAVSEFASIDK